MSHFHSVLYYLTTQYLIRLLFFNFDQTSSAQLNSFVQSFIQITSSIADSLHLKHGDIIQGE
jgi:hypothetical protein